MKIFCNTFFWKMAIKTCSIENFYKIWLSWKFPQFFFGGGRNLNTNLQCRNFFFNTNLLCWKMLKKLFSQKNGFVQKFSLKVALLESFKNNLLLFVKKLEEKEEVLFLLTSVTYHGNFWELARKLKTPSTIAIKLFEYFLHHFLACEQR